MELARLNSPRGDGEIGAAAPADVENQNGRMQEDEERTALLGEETLAEMEIHSLLWIKQTGNERFKEGLETWQAKDTLFASRVDKKRKQANSFRNEIYQLIGFYSVFQGVLLTAVAQSNMLTCHNWWTAFCLSLLASLVATAGVIQKFSSVLALEKTISNEETSRKECIRWVQKMLQLRENFSFQEHTKDRKIAVPRQTKLKNLIVKCLPLCQARTNRLYTEAQERTRLHGACCAVLVGTTQCIEPCSNCRVRHRVSHRNACPD